MSSCRSPSSARFSAHHWHIPAPCPHPCPSPKRIWSLSLITFTNELHSVEFDPSGAPKLTAHRKSSPARLYLLFFVSVMRNRVGRPQRFCDCTSIRASAAIFFSELSRRLP